MKISMLVENKNFSSEYEKRHGLSLYIETRFHKIIFDLGPDDAFIKNAEKLKINLKDVDIVIISHGHLDHSGGIKYFLNVNDKARIYIHKEAFLPHFSKVVDGSYVNIGIDENLYTNKRVLLVNENLKIDNELTLFCDINGSYLLPSSNNTLYTKTDKGYKLDNFHHEQNLLISYDNKKYVIAGCAHRGIINITEEGRKLAGKNIDYVIGGFHLRDPFLKKTVDSKTIKCLAAYIKSNKDTIFYTCHCTGKPAFDALKEISGEQIHYLKSGQCIDV